jgi:type I restriction enzyme S subunit
MALCDQLEAAQQGSERRRERLAAASLQRLNQSAADTTPKAQREHARFHLHHLPRLTTRPEHIKAMRQTILNLAVCGRLVRHDVGDESATTLLASIASTKSNLVKAGVIRKTAGLALLSPEDTVFQVPGGWVWERLGTVGYTQTGTTPPTSMPECFGGETPFVTPSDLTASVTTYDGKGLTDIGVRHSRLIAKNSVLMVCIGSTIGKVNVVDREVCCNQQINTLTPVIDGMTGYVAIALRSDYFQKLVITNAGMGTLPILSKGKWEQLPVPIPPLAEQHRIVAKVDELMALCDQLEAQLTITQTDSHRLLEAVLEDALAPA